jgi:hypothetical protein
MRDINETDRQEIINVLIKARTLSKEVSELLKYADFLGSEAAGQDPISETLTAINEDLLDAGGN